MKKQFRSVRPESQRGAAAVEAAVVIAFVLLPLLSLPAALGKYLWYYTVAQKAAHDAALYMSKAPLSEIKVSGSPAAELAKAIVAMETSDLSDDTPRDPTAICQYKASPKASPTWGNCNSVFSPIRVKAGVVMLVSNPFVPGDDGWPILAEASVAYVGR